jgi:hypothetical protein
MSLSLTYWNAFLFRKLAHGNQAPDAELILNRSPLRGVDIKVPPGAVERLGFRFAEIKPLSNPGYYRFNRQIARWKLSDPVQLITYDHDGNIYLGFPR